MDCAPRFDASRNDPFRLKPELANYNNEVNEKRPAKEQALNQTRKLRWIYSAKLQFNTKV